MLLLRIISKDRAQIERAAEILLVERFGIDVNLKTESQRLEMREGKLQATSLFVLTAKTKSLLYPDIEKRIKDEFPANTPEIYALPIVYMDWDQAKLLTKEVKHV